MRVSVVGEALVDLVANPTAEGGFTAHAGGSPYNVAVTLGRLGAPVELVAQCGRDAFGDLLTAKLTDSGVALGRWHTRSEPTSLAIATLDDEQRAQYSFYFDGTAGLEFDGLTADGLGEVVHTGSVASWLGGSGDRIATVLAELRAHGNTLISYDPNVRPALMPDRGAAVAAVERCVASAHLVKASDEDVAWLYPDRAPAETAVAWTALGAALVVVTRGPDGAVAFGTAGELAARPGLAVRVADTVGAGDSFSGGLLAALLARGRAKPDGVATPDASGSSELLDDAVLVAAMTCEQPGASPPTAAEFTNRRADLKIKG